MMKPLFTAAALSKGEDSENHPTPNALPKAAAMNLYAGRPSLTSYSWLTQSGRSPVRAPDDSLFMKSQLG